MGRTNLSDIDLAILADFSKGTVLSTFANIKNKLIDHDAALDSIGLPVYAAAGASTEVVTGGALTVTTPLSYISCTGTQAYTLANGTIDGQLKEIECTVAATTPVGTLTVATMDSMGGGANATFVFNTVGQRMSLKWNAANAAWHMTAKVRAGDVAVVVGTTVLTGFNMNLVYDLSVTGTVSSTGTKAIPVGHVPGEVIHVNTPTAAATPNGTIAILPGTVKGTDVAAATGLAGINATSCEATFVWSDPTNGWQNTTVTTATYS